MNAHVAVAVACALAFGSASAVSQLPLGTLKNLRIGMTWAEVTDADESAVCQEPKGRTSTCLVHITVAQVPSRVVIALVTTAPRAEFVIPKAPKAPQYEEVPSPTASDRRNGLTAAPGAAASAARNAERRRAYGDSVKVYEAARRAARARYEAQFKVAQIHVSFRSDQYEPFRRAYIAKFGQPAASKQVTYRNAMNATFEGTEDQWKSASADVALYQRCESTDRACLVIESIGLAPYVREANDLEVRDRVKDL
jgi:hypothetical protein